MILVQAGVDSGVDAVPYQYVGVCPGVGTFEFVALSTVADPDGHAAGVFVLAPDSDVLDIAGDRELPGRMFTHANPHIPDSTR